MKTRILLTTLVFIFSTFVVTEASNTIAKNAITLNSRISEKNVLHMSEVVHHSKFDSYLLEEWIAGRDNWEQEEAETESNSGMIESSLLENWINNRDSWEQAGAEIASHTTLYNTSFLEDWINTRDKWEQDGNETVNQNGLLNTNVMEEWIISRDNWEQK